MVTKQLVTLDRDGAVSVPGFKADAFGWKHRDIKLVRALARAVFRGNIDTARLGLEQRNPRALSLR